MDEPVYGRCRGHRVGEDLLSHCEKTRFEVMPSERRSYRSAIRVKSTSGFQLSLE